MLELSPTSGGRSPACTRSERGGVKSGAFGDEDFDADGVDPGGAEEDGGGAVSSSGNVRSSDIELTGGWLDDFGAVFGEFAAEELLPFGRAAEAGDGD